MAEIQDSKPRKGLGVVLLTIFIDLLGFSIIFPLLPALFDFYLADGNSTCQVLITRMVNFFQGLTPAQSLDTYFLTTVLFGGILGSLYTMLQFLSAPIWGRLSDRYGRRSILLITIGGNTLAYGIWIFSGSFWLFLVSRALAGIMAGNLSVATAAVADLSSSKNRTVAMAFMGVAFSLGFILGPVLGGSLASVNMLDYYPRCAHLGLNPFSAAAIAATVLSLTNCIWVALRFRESLPPSKRSHADVLATNRLEGMLQTKTPGIRITSWMNFLFTAALGSMEFTVTFLAVERFAYTPGENSLIFVFVGIVLLITQGFIVRKLVRFMSEIKILIVAAVIGFVGYLGMAYAHTPLCLYVSLGFVSLAVGLTTPTLTALLSLYASDRTQGRYMGAFRSAGALGRAFGPFTGALVYFLFSSSVCYWITALVLIFPFALSFRLPKPQK